MEEQLQTESLKVDDPIQNSPLAVTKLDNEFWYYSKERRFVVETVFHESVKSIGTEGCGRSGAIDGDRAITKMNIAEPSRIEL